MMKKQKLFQGVILLLCSLFFSCSPEPFVTPDDSGLFTKFFGGANDEEAFTVKETATGYLIVGTTSSKTKGGTDVLLISVDKNGNRKWERRYGDNRNQGGQDIVIDSNGDIFVLGFTNQENEVTGEVTDDILLMRINQEGDSLESIPLTKEANEKGAFVKITDDNKFLLVGTTKALEDAENSTSDLFLLKIDKEGNEEFIKTYGIRGEFDEVGSVVENPLGDLLICGTVSTSSEEESGNARIVALDNAGIIQWAFDYGGNLNNTGKDIELAPGGYVVTGAWGDSTYLMKIDNLGQQLFLKRYKESGVQEGAAVSSALDGGFIVTGTKEVDEASGGRNIHLFKTDNEGNQLWSNTFGGQGADRGVFVQESSDLDILLLSTVTIANNEVFGFMKVNEEGNALGDGKIEGD